jgi:hypothetical protein
MFTPAHAILKRAWTCFTNSLQLFAPVIEISQRGRIADERGIGARLALDIAASPFITTARAAALPAASRK